MRATVSSYVSATDIKATISSTASVARRFKSLAPSSDIATYAGEGYRFRVSNPNDFSVNAMTQFFNYQHSSVFVNNAGLDVDAGTAFDAAADLVALRKVLLGV